MTDKSIAPELPKAPAGYRFATVRGRSDRRLIRVDRRTGARTDIGVAVTRAGHFAVMDRIAAASAEARYGATTRRAKRRREKAAREVRQRAQRQMGRAA